MNNPAFSSYGNSEEEHGSYVSNNPENSFLSTLKKLPLKQPKSRKKRENKKQTAKDFVAQYYSELETARIEKNYDYSDLCQLINDQLGSNFSPATVKKYMDNNRREPRVKEDLTDTLPPSKPLPNAFKSSDTIHPRPASTPPPSDVPKPINNNTVPLDPVSSPPLEQTQQTEEEQKRQTPPRRVPSHLNVRPDESFRKTRTYE